MSLIELIYVSTATHELSDLELRQILDSSVRKNAARNITGMLLYSAGSFMQVLEGAEADVDESMARIEKDPRHHDIIELSRTQVPAPAFAQWSMGFRGLTAQDAKSSPGFAPFFEHGFNAEMIVAKPGLAIDLLKNFRG
jgi:hypothetical protein